MQPKYAMMSNVRYNEKTHHYDNTCATQPVIYDGLVTVTLGGYENDDTYIEYMWGRV